jgi:transmembrane sensor
MNSSTDDADRLQQEAMDWFVRRRDGGWNAQGEMRFQEWLAADARHAQRYAQCAAQWQQFDAMPKDLVARMRRQLASDQAQERAQNAQRAPQFSATRRRFWAWPAASTMALAAGGVGYAAWWRLQAQPLDVQAFATERGQQRSVRLPDGSQLRLDTATQIEVRLYRQRRELHLLDGQVALEVQADGRPFHVLAGTTRVTVVGTKFSVRYTPLIAGNAAARVAVEEGKVRVAALRPEEMQHGNYDLQAGRLLVAGQQVVVDAQGAAGAPRVLASEGMAPWRDQRVSFEDVPLSQALAELERYHATGLRVRDPQVAALRLSGTFDPMATSALHKALVRVLPVRVESRGDWSEVISIR